MISGHLSRDRRGDEYCFEQVLSTLSPPPPPSPGVVVDQCFPWISEVHQCAEASTGGPSRRQCRGMPRRRGCVQGWRRRGGAPRGRACAAPLDSGARSIAQNSAFGAVSAVCTEQGTLSKHAPPKSASDSLMLHFDRPTVPDGPPGRPTVRPTGLSACPTDRSTGRPLARLPVRLPGRPPDPSTDEPSKALADSAPNALGSEIGDWSGVGDGPNVAPAVAGRFPADLRCRASGGRRLQKLGGRHCVYSPGPGTHLRRYDRHLARGRPRLERATVADAGQLRGNTGHTSVDFDESLPKSAKACRTLSQFEPDSARCRPTFDQIWCTSANGGRVRPNYGLHSILDSGPRGALTRRGGRISSGNEVATSKMDSWPHSGLVTAHIACGSRSGTRNGQPIDTGRPNSKTPKVQLPEPGPVLVCVGIWDL